MPAGGDVIQLVHSQSYGSQDILNVYFFEAVDGTALLSDLATWFSTNVVPDVKAMQNSNLAHVGLNLVNLYDKGEIYELALSGGGTLAATQDVATFVAGAIRFPHSTANLRAGYKRIGGLEEGQLSGNFFHATTVTAMETISAHLINPLSPVLSKWVHVIVGRLKTIDVDGNVFYRLPLNQAEGVLGYPTSYEVRSLITSQNSRKNYAS